MAKKIHRLTALSLTRPVAKGLYPDGGGLYLQVTASGSKSWLYRFMLRGKARDMGLGPLHTLSLAEARARALDCRKLRLAGIDPIEHRRTGVAQAKLEEAKAITFQKCAEAYVAAHAPGWKNAKHGAQWTATLKTYAYPVIGQLSVQAVDTGLVLRVLEPIWAKKSETASRVRGRIEAVLDWARVRGYREGENPARWRGHLSEALPARAKVRRVRNHPALPYSDLGKFMAELRHQNGTAAKALRFTILTACRTGEVIGARWSEFDLKAAVWTIPAERMKGGREHRVPLSPQAVDVIKSMYEIDPVFVFPGNPKRGSNTARPVSNMSMLAVLKRMERTSITVHGFRSTFKDWASECTNTPNEVSEIALAHAIEDLSEAAYRRGDLFDKRRILMNEWARFSGTVRGKSNGTRPTSRAR